MLATDFSWRDSFALASLIGSLVAAFAFHFLPLESGWGSDITKGWETWMEIFASLRSLNFADLQTMIGSSCFITWIALVISSVPLFPILQRSRLAARFVTVCSALVLIGLGVVVAINNLGPEQNPGSAVFCLFASLLLHFIGIVLVRCQIPQLQGADPP